MFTLSELNEFHAQSWAKRATLMEGLLLDDAVVHMAIYDLSTETANLPFGLRKGFEAALEQAAERKTICLSWIGKKGGRPRGCDALQVVINDSVSKRRDLTVAQVLAILSNKKWEGVVEDVDEKKMEIWFIDKDGRRKASPISGLKDRLNRARKFRDSRIN
jgi:hypothetical protein